MKYFAMYLLTIILFFSCNSYKTKYPYSLDDFRPELRRHLERIVEFPTFCYIDEITSSYIDNHTSINELKKMYQSEHPILRAYGFKHLSQREDVNVGDILLQHLDDTAVIWGCSEEPVAVADYCINAARGHTQISREELVEKVLLKFPYLSHTTSFFNENLGEEKFYPILKNIIEKDYKLHRVDWTSLIFSLSSYKKLEDTLVIKGALMSNWGDEEYKKFQLIENNPLQSYFFVINQFYQKLQSYKVQYVLQTKFESQIKFSLAFDSFILAIASFQSQRSATLFSEILKQKLHNVSERDKIFPEKSYHIHYKIYKAITKYKCSSYSSILKAVEKNAKIYADRYIHDESSADTEASIPEKNFGMW